MKQLHLRICFALLICLICSSLFFVKRHPYEPPIRLDTTLNAIPLQDKEALEWFFRYLHESSSGFVLFGDKPMSICSFLEMKPTQPITSSYPLEAFIDAAFEPFHLKNLRMQKGLEVWKKYEHYFPSSKFILRENRNPTNNWVTIVLINKDEFLKKIANNIESFKKVLGNRVTPQKILSECLKSESLFREVLHSHDGLLGILLGYGEHNAQLYFRKIQIEGARDNQRFSLTTKNCLLPSGKFSSLEEEHSYISMQLSPFTDGEIPDFNPLLMTLPGFSADPHDSETRELKAKYTQQYKNIIKQYRQKDYLRVTLSRFTDHDNSTKEKRST